MISSDPPFSTAGDETEPYPNATTNACKLCTPLGACLAFRGIEGAVPFLHGSQGCATYIRRYLISHFREPMDIAASNFSESSAVFGGGANLKTGLANVLRQYQPKLIGLATTCLSETIGEDVPGHLNDFAGSPEGAQNETPIVPVSTASFRGTHVDGFHDAVKALVQSLAKGTPESFPGHAPIAVLPGMVSAADLREIKRIAREFGVPLTLLPDYSETLDGPSWADYEKLPTGGTPVAAIRALPRSRAMIECGRTLAYRGSTAATVAKDKHGVEIHRIGLPIGLRETDALIRLLSSLSGRPVPHSLKLERGRLLDSWVDGHKYVFEKRAIVYGEEDLVVGLASLLAEIGIIPILCASGGKSGRLGDAILSAAPSLKGRCEIRSGVDFAEISSRGAELRPDFLIGSSKGYSLARKLGIPLIRCGFPIHDRIGGQRVLHVGYAGAQQLFDSITNALLERKQADSAIGYSYL
ncbi:MAG: nitrogenase component 1 [Opitutaceae bacterium]|nr:nitrogenase component 1 [Opitutaceae bacterium]